MPLPDSVTSITVTGQNICDASGVPYYGTVTFTPASIETSGSVPIVIGTTPIVQTVTNGVMSPVTLATNDSDLSPSNSYYTVTQQYAYSAGDAITSTDKYAIQLFSTMGDTVDLGALTPATTLPTTVTYLVAANNLSDVPNKPLALTNLGVVPAAVGTAGLVDPPGGTSEFYRADGTWADPAGMVTSVFGREGAVVAESGDYSGFYDALGAATTAQSNAETFATSAVNTETSRAEAAEALLAPLASPALTGTPTAPTKAALTNNTDIATTAYTDSAVGVETLRATAAEALKAPLASPSFTGSPTAPTQTTGDNSTKIATDAFVTTAVAAETTRAEAAEALLAPLASPALTGTPTAPTRTALTNNTDIATTAYADSAVGVETARAEAAEATKLTASNSLSELTSTAVTARSNIGAEAFLIPAAVQNASFSASVNTYYPIDCSAGSVTATLPAQPADESIVAFKIVNGNQQNQYTAGIVVGSGDYFNFSGTTSTRTLALPFQAIYLQYQASTRIWFETDSLPLNQLTQTFPTDWLNVKKYGAAGNGKQITDCGMMGAAPATPVPTTATTGGTILAGAYGVVVTYVNITGETVGSAAGSVTTSGTTSTITIPSPGYAGNATGWNAYVSQLGGSTYTLQNSSPTVLNAGLTLTAPPTSTGVNPPVTATGNTTLTSVSQASFTSSDVGKLVVVFGAGPLNGTIGTPLAGTISAVVSSTQATLSVAATSNTPVNVSTPNAVANYGSDDKAFIQAAINACNNGQTVSLPYGMYAISGELTITKPMRLTGDGATIFSTNSAIVNFNNTYISAGSSTSTTTGLEIDHLVLDAAGGHVFYNTNFNRASWHDLRLVQRSYNYAIWYCINSTDNQLDLYMYNVTNRVNGSPRTIPAYYVLSSIGGGMAMCNLISTLFQNNDGDNTQYYVVFDAGSTHNYTNCMTFDNVWFDRAFGGAVQLLSVQSANFRSCNVIDSYTQTINGSSVSWGTNSAYYVGTTKQAPVVPTVSTATTGGTVLAGTYQVEITYYFSNGTETVASPSSAIVTTGSTSTITINSPSAYTGAVGAATGWHAYVTAANGTTYFRQEAQGSPNAIGTNLTLTAPPSTSGGNPNQPFPSQKVSFRDCGRDLQGPNGSTSWDVYLESTVDSVVVDTYLVRDIPPSTLFFPYFNFNNATNVYQNNNNGAVITNAASTYVNVGPSGNVSLSGTITGAYSQPVILPSDYNYLAWPYPPFLMTGSTTLTSGSLYAIALFVRQTITVTGLAFILSTSMVGGVAAENFGALYSSNGATQLAITADVTATFAGGTSSSPKKIPFTSPVVLGPGTYWATLLANYATTGPAIGSRTPNPAVQMPTGSAPSQTNIVATTQTAMPSTITLSGSTGQAAYDWVAFY